MTVTAPAGSWMFWLMKEKGKNENIYCAIKSAVNSKREDSSILIGKLFLASSPTIRLAMWGPIKPIKPIAPTIETAPAVKRAEMKNKRAFVFFKERPRSTADSVPSLQAFAIPAVNNPAMSAGTAIGHKRFKRIQILPFSDPIVHNKMLPSASWCLSKINEVTACNTAEINHAV